jgi:hypothetical protein
VLVAIGLFAQELGLIGVPGTWFSFGIGVSRSEHAYAAFDAVLSPYLLQGLLGALRRRGRAALAKNKAI